MFYKNVSTLKIDKIKKKLMFFNFCEKVILIREIFSVKGKKKSSNFSSAGLNLSEKKILSYIVFTTI